jgi:hypothetical protein
VLDDCVDRPYEEVGERIAKIVQVVMLGCGGVWVAN